MRRTYDTIRLCECCIAAIRSRGEKVFVGEEIDQEDEDNLLTCEWCEDENDELYECHF